VHPIEAADSLLGRAVERSMAAHHRRRLRRLGRPEALAPRDHGSPWSREFPPPRDGCAIEVLIDGADVFAAIAEAIRGARRSVRIAGWHVAPHFALERAEPPTLLRELLALAVARGAIAGTPRDIRPAGGSAGTMPARNFAARSSPTSPSTSICAGRR
jgi:phosphatidylserine/phosphatidylglycerophosphate/cardiolipin synthase-like enzyme